jgi:heterodisulfide reductase subunit C
VAERITWNDDTFMREVERRSGTSVSACYQCHKCSTGCPVGVEMERLTSQLMRLLFLGAEREVIESEAIWLCASCETCTARCPMGIDIASVLDTLRMMAVERGVTIPNKRSVEFGRAFLNSVARYGRVWELGTVIDYKVRTLDLFSDIDKAMSMVSRRKLSPIPGRSSRVAAVRRVFERSQKEEELR